MALATIKACATCGADYETSRPKQARYCSFCAAANGILYFKEKQVKCLACKAAFCPATSRDTLCSRCDHNPCFCRAVVFGNCRWCDRTGVNLADKDIPVCFHCWKDPEKRQQLIKSLAKKRAARIADNEGSTTA